MDRCLEPCARGGDVPPMGGKRTLRSIRKQSVPHMFAIVGGARYLGVLENERWL